MSSLRILLTRPEPGAYDTARRLREAGHEVVIDPVVEVTILPPPEMDLPAPGALAVTSRQALRALERWPQALEWRDLPLYAVGDATAESAWDLGFTNVRSAGGDAAALADFILAHHTPQAGPVLYPAAVERAVDLAGLLSAGGLKTMLVEAYKVAPVPALGPTTVAALAAGEIDVVLVYSRRSAGAFADLVDRAGLAGAVTALVAMALSPKVAEPLAALDLKEVLTSSTPDEAGMLAAIETLRHGGAR